MTGTGNEAAVIELRRSVARMGKTADERMTWVLDFIRTDLDAKRPGEVESIGYDLRGVVVLSLPPTSRYKMRKRPLPDLELRDYQQQIARGLNGLFADPPQPWIFTGQPCVVVARTRMKGRRRRFAIQHDGGDEAAAIVRGVIQLASDLGERLRSCQQCHALFVAVHKSEFCSTKCTQRYWNERRKTNTKGEGSK